MREGRAAKWLERRVQGVCGKCSTWKRDVRLRRRVSADEDTYRPLRRFPRVRERVFRLLSEKPKFGFSGWPTGLVSARDFPGCESCWRIRRSPSRQAACISQRVAASGSGVSSSASGGVRGSGRLVVSVVIAEAEVRPAFFAGRAASGGDSSVEQAGLEPALVGRAPPSPSKRSGVWRRVAVREPISPLLNRGIRAKKKPGAGTSSKPGFKVRADPSGRLGRRLTCPQLQRTWATGTMCGKSV